jgi:PAS domain S-box-containing protein
MTNMLTTVHNQLLTPGVESDQLDIRQQLLLREAQLSEAQRMAGMASWEWYFGDTEIRWSPEMYAFWGYAPDEIAVNLDSVAQSTHLDDLPILQGAIARALQGEDVEMEYRRFDKLGREVFIHTIGRIIRNEQGGPVGVFGIDMNVTKRKQQEQNLANLNQELAAKNLELEKRNAELRSFSYVASHDLQEPLRKIRTFNNLILERDSANLSPETQDFFRRSMSAAERMQRLIKDLIAYSETDTRAHPHKPVDLVELLDQVRADLSETILSTGAMIQASALPTVPVVEFMFRQLMHNLIGNSLKYAQPNVPPVIRLTYEKTNQVTKQAGGELTAKAQYHTLTFIDNGIGFDPVYNQKIFQLFQRLHGHTEFAGTGIGLAICQRIMENHGGTITADSRIGEGATFTACWPVRELSESSV